LKRKREKGYWEKRSEKFKDGTGAKSRAAELRSHDCVAHVQVEKAGGSYIVAYSVASWYLEELSKAGVKL